VEYCDGGDLGVYIEDLKTNNEFAKEWLVWNVLAQLVSALYYCHYGADHSKVEPNILKPKSGDRTVLHRDLKPKNSKL
jgi:NIMA (never in mitosis gene a)-related kinase